MHLYIRLSIMFIIMCTAPPVPSLAAEGTLWFTDLSKRDSYGILPILLAVANLVNIEVCLSSIILRSTCKHFKCCHTHRLACSIIHNSICSIVLLQLHVLGRPSPTRLQRTITNTLRILSVAMCFIAMRLPTVSLHSFLNACIMHY